MSIDRKKILIVDDDINMLKIMQIFLEKKGYCVVTVSKGFEAMINIERERPNLILLDILLDKNLSSEIIIHNIKENKLLCQIPIIMVTALTSYTSKQRFIDELGCDGYVEKPFDSEDLLDKINRLI